ncbi:MAG: ChrR family anti-sigma-E factor [Roseobacter sp.]
MSEQINHHLNDAVMMAYSAGTLPEAFNLIVAAHISLCDSCRARAESFDALGGELLDNSTDAEITGQCFSNTMDLIEGGPVIDVANLARSATGVLPGPIQDYVGGDLDSVKWKPIGMGVKQAILTTSKEATARLLLIPAGTAMPDHGHHGTEMTLVLKGAFKDDDGYFARGDLEVADSDLHHMPVADIHEDCVCLAVADAPLQFDRLIPRIAQRFLRI